MLLEKFGNWFSKCKDCLVLFFASFSKIKKFQKLLLKKLNTEVKNENSSYIC